MLLLPGLVQAFEDAAVAAVNTTHVVLGTPVLATEVLVVSDAVWLPSTGVGVVGLLLLFPDDGRLDGGCRRRTPLVGERGRS